MTLNGAIMQLVEMRESVFMPTLFKPALDKVIETISECEEPSVQQQWIPCSERLPEPNRHDALNVDVYYLAQTEFGDMIVASYNESHKGTKWWEQMYSYRIFDDEIVAWMPLPEPYRKTEAHEREGE